MKTLFPVAGSILIAVLLVCQVQTAMADDVRLNGAASVVDSLISPHKSAVEKATGNTLVVNRSTAGKGLLDLINAKCDAALVSASLEASVAAAKSAGLDKPVPQDLQMHVIAKSEVVFIVHPANPVKALTWEQIRDMHTGKITNWKDVGGKDQPVAVFTDAAASATRGLIKQVVMGGSDYAKTAKALDFVKKVNDDVALTENAIGGLGIGFVNTAQVRIIETKKIERPLAFVTIAKPSDKLQKVMDAFKAASAQ